MSELAAQVEEFNAAWRDEQATDRHASFIPDADRPDLYDLLMLERDAGRDISDWRRRYGIR